MPSRWDFLYDRKPVPLAEHLVEELARLLAQELAAWPPAVHGFATPKDRARFARLLEPGAPRPDAKVFAGAFRLARLDLEREWAQVDEIMRNERWREWAAPGDGYDALILLSRWLVEQALSIAEATEGRIKRPQLVDCLERAERRLAATRVP